MEDDASGARPANKPSWRERLSQALAGPPHNRDALVTQLRAARTRGLFDGDALAMLEGALAVADLQVREVMVPRSHMVVLSRDISLDDALPAIINSGHSRFPVVGDSRDDVLGIVHAKDLLRHFADPESGHFNIREHLRKASVVPENKHLNTLLKDFRGGRNHLAMVADEYGGVSGLVTIEDVIEQIVGDIEDEHDIDDGVDIVRHTRDRFSVKALTDIDDFNAYFGTHLSSDEFETIGGLVMHGLAHMAKRGEVTTLGGWHFRVVRADSRRIHLLEVTPASTSSPADPS